MASPDRYNIFQVRYGILFPRIFFHLDHSYYNDPVCHYFHWNSYNLLATISTRIAGICLPLPPYLGIMESEYYGGLLGTKREGA